MAGARGAGHVADAPGGASIRVMTIDAAPVANSATRRILRASPDLALTATAATIGHALDLLRRVTVDVIVLDVGEPGGDGLSAMPDLIARAGGARVLLLSPSTAEAAETTVRALTDGASDTLLKPATTDATGAFAHALVDRVRRLGRGASPVPPPCAPPVRRRGLEAMGDAGVECIAIGASAGGPHALASLFRALPERLGVPILVTQHLPPPLMPGLARRLEEIARRAVTVARDGALVTAGDILIAPGDAHLRVVRARDGVRVALDRALSASGLMPSVDSMLVSVADVYGRLVTAVVLSGAGRDGLIGAGLLAAQGGEVLVQDAATATAWGMPGVIARAGLAADMLTPDEIARRIARRCHRNRGFVRWM